MTCKPGFMLPVEQRRCGGENPPNTSTQCRWPRLYRRLFTVVQARGAQRCMRLLVPSLLPFWEKLANQGAPEDETLGTPSAAANGRSRSGNPRCDPETDGCARRKAFHDSNSGGRPMSITDQSCGTCQAWPWSLPGETRLVGRGEDTPGKASSSNCLPTQDESNPRPSNHKSSSSSSSSNRYITGRNAALGPPDPESVPLPPAHPVETIPRYATYSQ